MELKIDGRPVDAQPGETLLTLVRRLGLDTGELPTRPLAARMAGETFTLQLCAGARDGGRHAPAGAAGGAHVARGDRARAVRLEPRQVRV